MPHWPIVGMGAMGAGAMIKLNGLPGHESSYSNVPLKTSEHPVEGIIRIADEFVLVISK